MEAEKAQQKEKDMQQAGHQEQPSAGQDDGMCRTTVRLSLATRAEIDRMVHDKYGRTAALAHNPRVGGPGPAGGPRQVRDRQMR
jgi:hypothetical protein